MFPHSLICRGEGRALRSQQHPWLLHPALNGTYCFAVSQPALGVPAGLPQRRGQPPGCGPASDPYCSGLPPGPSSARTQDLALAQIRLRALVPGCLSPAVLGSKWLLQSQHSHRPPHLSGEAGGPIHCDWPVAECGQSGRRSWLLFSCWGALSWSVRAGQWGRSELHKALSWRPFFLVSLGWRRRTWVPGR